MSTFHQPADHIGAHATQSNHSELHSFRFSHNSSSYCFCEFTESLAAICSCFIAPATPWLAPKIEVPATRTLAARIEGAILIARRMGFWFRLRFSQRGLWLRFASLIPA